MRVVAMECFVVRIPFRFSFRHALAERRQADSVLLRVELAGGAVGWGEAVPRAYLTGESVESVVDDLRARWAPALRELDFPPRESPLPALAPL
ncbi:MAG: hypothetical protein J6333_00365, partial [Planctomycetes bacterium]|nr:hypothetical protein [Planctomycetota bacterium]